MGWIPFSRKRICQSAMAVVALLALYWYGLPWWYLHFRWLPAVESPTDTIYFDHAEGGQRSVRDDSIGDIGCYRNRWRGWITRRLLDPKEPERVRLAMARALGGSWPSSPWAVQPLLRILLDTSAPMPLCQQALYSLHSNSTAEGIRMACDPKTALGRDLGARLEAARKDGYTFAAGYAGSAYRLLEREQGGHPAP